MTAPSTATATSTTLPAAVITAWQDALTAEYRALYLYGLLGPRLTAPARIDLARRDDAAHRVIRDLQWTALRTAGADPVGAAGSYPTPFAVTDETSAVRAAAAAEDGCAVAWRSLLATVVSGSSSELLMIRKSAVAELTSAAVRAVQWRAALDRPTASKAFPGVGS